MKRSGISVRAVGSLLALLIVVAVAGAAPLPATLVSVKAYPPAGGTGTVVDRTADTSTWTYDPVTGTAVQTGGTYIGAFKISPVTTILTDTMTGVTLSSGAATGTTWTCTEGNFGPSIGAHICGNYSFGGNFVNDSIYTPTTTGAMVTLGGDDTASGSPRSLALFNGMTSIDMGAGAYLLSNTVPPGGPGAAGPGTYDFVFQTGAAAVDDGPIAVTEGVPEIIAVGANDTGFVDPVTVSVTSPPSKGSIGAISPTGPAAGQTITYTANIGATGGDTFVYDMTDSTPGTPLSDLATVSVNISAPPPVVVTLLSDNSRNNSGALYFHAFKTCTPATGNGCYNTANSWYVANGVTGSDATWTWNGTTLAATGTFWTTNFQGNNPSLQSVISDKTINLAINTTTLTTTASTYNCVNGSFLELVGGNGCLNTSLGGNVVDDSTVLYNVGGDANCVQRTLGGDDTSGGNPRGLFTAGAVGACDAVAGAYDLYTVVADNTSTGGNLVISNGIPVGTCLTLGCAAEPASAGAHWLTFAPGSPGDTTPDAFVFTDQTGVPVSTVRTSNTVTILGITASAAVTITGGEYSIGCTATFVSSAGTVNNGQSICVRHTSAGTGGAATNTVLTVGGVSDTFTSTTGVASVTATPSTSSPGVGATFTVTLSISDIVNSLGGTVTMAFDASKVSYVSAVRPASGPMAASSGSFLIVNGTNPRTIDFLPGLPPLNGSFDLAVITFNTIAPGDSGIVFSDDGGILTGWYDNTTANYIPVDYNQASVTVVDTTPDAFVFIDQTDVPASSVRTSNTILVTGINTPVSISVSGDPSSEYSVNAAPFTNVPGTVNNGNSVYVRHTSSASYSTATDTVLTIGGSVSDTFTSTTIPPPPVTQVTTVSGLLGPTEEGCLQNLLTAVSDGENCMYDGGPSSVATAIPFGEVMGPFQIMAYYDSVATPAAFQSTIVGLGRELYVPTAGDGKISQAITGSITVDDGGDGFGAGDLISFNLTLTSSGGGDIVRARTAAIPTVAEKYSSMTQVLAPVAASSATPNGFGGYDYIIGSEGFPALLTYSSAAPVQNPTLVSTTNVQNGVSEIFSSTFDGALIPCGGGSPAYCSFFGGDPPAAPPAVRAMALTPTPTGVGAGVPSGITPAPTAGSYLGLALGSGNTQVTLTGGTVKLPDFTLTITHISGTAVITISGAGMVFGAGPQVAAVNASGVAEFLVDLNPSTAVDFSTISDVATSCTGTLCPVVPLLTFDMIRYRLVIDYDPTFTSFTASFIGQTANNSLLFLDLDSEPSGTTCIGLPLGSVECFHTFTVGQTDPDFWDGTTSAGLGSLEGNLGAKVTGSVADLACIDSQNSSGVESNDCRDNTLAYSPYLGVAGACAAPGGCVVGVERGAAEDVGWDQLLLKVSTDASGNVVSAAGFNVDEFQVFGSTRCGDNTTGTGTYSANCNSWTSGYFTLAVADTIPDAFAFTDQTDVALSATITSGAISVTGIDAPAAISVSGAGSSEYSINAGAFTSTAGTVSNGDSVVVRHTSSASLSTATDTVLTIGGVSDTFTSTTLAVLPDTTPDPFVFTDVINVARNSVVTSNAVTITGINAPAAISVSGGLSPGYSIGCTATFTSTAGNITNGQTVCVQHTAPNTYSTPTDTTLTVGGVADTFTSTTVVDNTPDPFTFIDQTDVPVATLITSAAVTITGIDTPTTISVIGGVYSIGCTGTYTAVTGNVLNNETVCVQHTSAATGGVATNTTLTVGPESDTFTSTTILDTVPDAFAFTPQTGVPVSTVRTSDPVAIAGINAATPISVSGGTYSKNGGGFTSSAGSVSNGDSIRLRHTSAATDGVAVNTTLTVGGVPGTFTSTTFATTSFTGYAGGTVYYDPDLDITWLADANYAKTSGYDADGLMTWAEAQAWIASLNAGGFLGVSSWRLPGVTDSGASGCDSAYTGTDCGWNVDVNTGEMAHMYYSSLGNFGGFDTSSVEQTCNTAAPTYCLYRVGPFSNLQAGSPYWSGTTHAPNSNEAWDFGFAGGRQNAVDKSGSGYAWAVVDGNPLSVQAPAPTIGSVSPNPVTGSASPQVITINGTNFINKPTVTLTWTGQLGYVVPTAQVTFVSSTVLQISVTTGINADNWTARVTNPDGQSSNTANFSVGAPQAPQISGVTPNSLTVSASPQTVTINGVYFVSPPTLTLTWPGEAGYTVPAQQVTYLSSNQLQMSVTPATAGSWTVRATNPDTQQSNTVGFTVVAPVAPAIAAVFPDPVTGSASPQTITIYGTDFANKPTLTLTSAAQPGGFTVPAGDVTFLSSSELRMSVTTGVVADASWTVQATNPNLQQSNTLGFSVIEPDVTSGTVPMYELKPDLAKLRLYYLNVTTGERTAVISEVDTGPNPTDIKFGKSFESWPFPDGTFAYVVNSGDNTISTFAVDPADGDLTLATSAATGADPRCVTLDPGGGVANVVNGDGTISNYSVNPDTGALIPAGLFSPATPASCPLTTTPATGLATPYVGNPFLFVLNPGNQSIGWKDSISVFGINAVNGALTAVPGSPFRINTNQSERLRSSSAPSGTYLYVLGGADSATAVIGLNALTGALTEVPGSPFPIPQGGDAPVDTALDPGGVFQYVINGDSNILGYQVDAQTGQFVSLGTLVNAPQDAELTSAAIDPGGNRLYVADDDVNASAGGVVRAYQIDRNSGGLTLIGAPVDAGEHPQFVTVHPSGRFVYILNKLALDDSGAISAFSIEPTTGALTPLGVAAPTGRYPTAPLTVHPNGQFAYTTNEFDGTISAFRIDSVTGALYPIDGSPFASGGTEPYTVTIASNGKFAYVANTGAGTISAFSIDQATGALTPVPGSPFPSDFQSAPSTAPRAVIFTPQ